MSIRYEAGTPGHVGRMRERTTSNACDFVRFDDQHFSIFALDGDEPVGLIAGKRRALPAPLEPVEEAFIDIIEVQPEYRRRGIGTALVEHAITGARANGAVQIRAWSEEIRTEALLLWNKLGFTFSRVDFQDGNGQRYGFYVARRL